MELSRPASAADSTQSLSLIGGTMAVYNTISSDVGTGGAPKTTKTMKLLVACALAASFVLGTLAVTAVSGADPGTSQLIKKGCKKGEVSKGGKCFPWPSELKFPGFVKEGGRCAPHGTHGFCDSGLSCNSKGLFPDDENCCVKDSDKGEKCDISSSIFSSFEGVDCISGLCCKDRDDDKPGFCNFC